MLLFYMLHHLSHYNCFYDTIWRQYFYLGFSF